MRKVQIEINIHKPSARTILNNTKKTVARYGFQISTRPDFVIVIGGDGTILHAAQTYCKKDILILGVNAGGLGFLTDITLKQLPEILHAITEKRFMIEQRMMVQARLNRTIFQALNDMSIVTRIPGRAVEITATVRREYLYRFLADGIIIATPTGSTAYSLATGGPILIPSTEGLVVTPIAPHTLSVRPIVLPADSTIEIQIGKKGKASLVADGQLSQAIKNKQKVVFKRSRYSVKLIKPLQTTFFNTLREKMKWGGREDA